MMIGQQSIRTRLRSPKDQSFLLAPRPNRAFERTGCAPSFAGRAPRRSMRCWADRPSQLMIDMTHLEEDNL